MAYVSAGPVSTLPGYKSTAPDSSACDQCGKPAAYRIQGETDSFGAEFEDLCTDCFQSHQEQIEAQPSGLERCDWCHSMSDDVRPYRDMEEGMCGPVYDVCGACRKKDADAWLSEI